MMRRALLGIAALALSTQLASAQYAAQPSNFNFIVPTAPLGTNNNQAASTAFVIANSTALGLGTFATQNYATPPAIGGTTPNTGAFTTLSSTGTYTNTAGNIFLTGSTSSLRLGNPGTSNTPFIDFRSSGLSPDFDARLLASGGSATDGGGVLQLQGTFNIVTLPGTAIKALQTVQSGPASGTLAANVDFNKIIISSDQYALGTTNTASGFTVDYTFGGANLIGVRTATYSHATFSAASSASNTNANYVGDVARIDVNASDGGTNTGAGSKGAFFGRQTVVAAESVALSNVGALVGHEYDFSINSGSTVRAIVGTSVTKQNNDVRGVVYDAAYSVGANGPAHWNCGYCVTDYNGAVGISSIGTVVGYVNVGNVVAPWSAAWGADFGDGVTTGLAFSGGAFRSRNFLVDTTGNTTGLTFKVGSNQVVGARQTGWTVATGTPSRATYATSTVNLATLSGVVMALEQDLITHGLIGP